MALAGLHRPEHRLAIVTTHARLAVLVVLAVTLAGCMGSIPHPSPDAAELQALFPTLAAHHVTNLLDSGWCDFIAYDHGAFINSNDPNCVGMTAPDEPFEAGAGPLEGTALRDFNAIEEVAAQLGRPLYSAAPVYGKDGSITGGQFMLDDCTTYYYQPGWSFFPTLAPGQVYGPTYVPVNGDWYLKECQYL